METEQKIWAKTLISTYSYLETICGAIDKTVLSYGINSGLSLDVEFVANKIISLTARKKFMINTKVLIDNVLSRLDSEFARILVLKYIDKIKSETASQVLNISMRSYFRKINLAIDEFALQLKKFGYNSKKLYEIFKNENWIMEMYNSYKNKELRDCNMDSMNFLGMAINTIKRKSMRLYN